MKRSRDTAVLVLLVLATTLIGACWAQEDETIEIGLNLEQGHEVYYEHQTAINQTFKGGPLPGLKLTMDIMYGFYQRTTKFDGKGPAEIEQTWDRIKIYQDSGMTKMSFDSDHPELAKDVPLGGGDSSMSELLARQVGSKITITLEPNGKETKLSGMEALVKKMFEGLPEVPEFELATAKIKQDMTDEKMRCTVLQNQTLFLPPGPVSVGATWNIKEAMDVPLLGKMIYDWNCTLKAVEGSSGSRVAVISIQGDVKPADDGAIDFMGGMAKLKLDKRTQEGEVLFDLDKGEVISSTINETSQMTLEIPGMVDSMVLDQTSVTKFTRKDPEVRAKEVEEIKQAREEGSDGEKR
ncbi:MAG: DUF6263 family protein [Planctomycetota bacterium]|nr:DUF6263 family protein [Planctomycetota bacterium]